MDKFFMTKGSLWSPFIIMMTVTLTRMGFHTHIAGPEFVVIPILALLLVFLPGIIQYAYVCGYALGGFASMSGWVVEGYLIAIILGSGILCLAGWMKCKEILFNPGDLTDSSVERARDASAIFRVALMVLPISGWAALGGWYLDFEFTYRMVLIIAAVYLFAIMWLGMSFLTDIYTFSTGKTMEYVEDDTCYYY